MGYKRGRRNTYHHTSLLKIDGVNDQEGSRFYFGKKVAYIYKASKAVSGSKFRVVWGKVMRGHGSNGVVRAKFSTNLSVSTFALVLIHPNQFFSAYHHGFQCQSYALPQQNLNPLICKVTHSSSSFRLC